MKKLKQSSSVITLILLFFNAFQLNAQSFVVENNKWNVKKYSLFSNMTSTYFIKIGGDTLINNITYNKTYRSVDSSDWVLHHHVREDASKKVYLKTSDVGERLIYDFGLAINDTFKINESCTLIVDQIDSVQLNSGEYRKRLTLTKKYDPDWGEQYWIDGIGTNLGLFTHDGFCYYDYVESLLCFYSNDELLFPEAPFSCYIQTSVRELGADQSINIYPNPTVDKIFIEDEKSILKDYTILNASGQAIESRELITSHLHEINFQNKSPGLYLIRFNTGEANGYSYRLIKM